MSNSTTNRRALLVRAAVEGDEVRITIDDAVNPPGSGDAWVMADHVSSKLLSQASLSTMTFEEKELADLAFFVLSRLSAFVDRGET